MTAIVRVENLFKSFRPHLLGPAVQALRGVSFAVQEGRCFGCLGRNGAGKTTILKIVTGLLRPDQGNAELLGQPCGTEHARRRLGYLPENPYFYEHLTPQEGLQLLGRLSGLTAHDIRLRSPVLLQRVELDHAKSQRIRTFSKGMRQRFGLAAALLAEPELLLLDEPLSGLDPGGRRLLKEIILEERKAGCTVLLCSHVLADVEELCEEVVVLQRGKVVREGAIKELLQDDPLSYELCVEGVDDTFVENLEKQALAPARKLGRRWQLRFDGAELGPQLAAMVHAAGGRVHSLVPERHSLEEWFVRLTDPPSADASEPVEPLERSEATTAEALQEVQP